MKKYIPKAWKLKFYIYYHPSMSLKELFERADFVKFAKFTASEEENASALPVAVRFVTSTYQTDVEEESGAQVEEEKEVKDVL